MMADHLPGEGTRGRQPALGRWLIAAYLHPERESSLGEGGYTSARERGQHLLTCRSITVVSGNLERWKGGESLRQWLKFLLTGCTSR